MTPELLSVIQQGVVVLLGIFVVTAIKNPDAIQQLMLRYIQGKKATSEPAATANGKPPPAQDMFSLALLVGQNAQAITTAQAFHLSYATVTDQRLGAIEKKVDGKLTSIESELQSIRRLLEEKAS